jgi:hypothetical protein
MDIENTPFVLAELLSLPRLTCLPPDSLPQRPWHNGSETYSTFSDVIPRELKLEDTGASWLLGEQDLNGA